MFEYLVECVGRVFDGKVVVGEDWMIIDIQDLFLVYVFEDIDDFFEFIGCSEILVKQILYYSMLVWKLFLWFWCLVMVVLVNCFLFVGCVFV